MGDNNKHISRPFFAVDMYGGYHFLFVYLDQDVEDPEVYSASPYGSSSDDDSG
jgi:hypothetical protein